MTCREGQYGSSEKICNIGAREGCATDPRVKTADFARKTARKAPNIACSELASHDVADFFGGAIILLQERMDRGQEHRKSQVGSGCFQAILVDLEGYLASQD